MNIKIISFRQLFMYAVPLFLMLSGALLLNREIEINDFFKRRLTRIITPFVFYVIVFVIVEYFIMSTVPGFAGLSEYINKVPFNHSWYFWLILGLYICVPIINKFVMHSTIKEIEYFILVLFLGSIFYQVMFILNITHYVNLNMVLSPIAYLVLGYYLTNKEFKMSKNKIITISILLVLLVSAIKIISVNGAIPFDYVTGYDITQTSRVATRVDLGIFELIRVSALFLIFRYLFDSESGIYSRIRSIFENNVLTRFYTSVSKSSYGMYLFHSTIYVPLTILMGNLSLTGSQVCLLIIALIFFLNIASWIVVLAINRIPFINKFSGYH